LREPPKSRLRGKPGETHSEKPETHNEKLKRIKPPLPHSLPRPSRRTLLLNQFCFR
jgi:hypothetical protein